MKVTVKGYDSFVVTNVGGIRLLRQLAFWLLRKSGCMPAKFVFEGDAADMSVITEMEVEP